MSDTELTGDTDVDDQKPDHVQGSPDVDSEQSTTEPTPHVEGAENESAGAAEAVQDEGDVAADYLEELLDIVDIDGDLDIEISGERTYISIHAEDNAEELDNLVGVEGQVLDALQELTRLAVLAATDQRTRLIVDINGHRISRQKQLANIAAKAISVVQESGGVEHLNPMSAYERKIIHDHIAEAGLNSASEGEGRRRHVVISAS